MLGSPGNTPYDLRFSVLGIPVRVHPMFWLIMLLLSGQSNDLPAAFVFVLCAFVSILIHELGHGLSSRLFGNEPVGIVLYGMGGYCEFTGWLKSSWKRIAVLFCGPGAGFLLLGLTVAVRVLGNVYEWDGLDHPMVQAAIWDLIEINFLWGVLNLLPMWPLDGGRITEVILNLFNPASGTRWTHVVSLLTAGIIAMFAATQSQYFMALCFGYFGLVNYQMLQSIHQSFRVERWDS